MSIAFEIVYTTLIFDRNFSKLKNSKKVDKKRGMKYTDYYEIKFLCVGVRVINIMQKNVKRIVFAIFLAATLMLSSCEATTPNDDGDSAGMPPPVEISDENPDTESSDTAKDEQLTSSYEIRTDNYLSINKFDSFKETYVGGTRGGTICYDGNPTVLSYEISDPSVISFEFIELYVYEGSVSQHFEVAGLKPGRATVEVIFAEGYGNPNATASIEVVVFAEMWPGDPYHGDYSIQTYVGGTNGGSFSYAGDPAILSYEISDPSVISFEFAGVSVHAYDFEDHVVQNYEITGLKTGWTTVTITLAESHGAPHTIAPFEIEVAVFDEIWTEFPHHNEFYKETFVGGTDGGSILYAGKRKRLSYEISDPSVVSFEFTFGSVHAHYAHYDVNGHYDEDELEYSAVQNYGITGLKPGRATVEIAFAFPEEGGPHTIALIEVVVYDEICGGVSLSPLRYPGSLSGITRN